MKRRFIIGSIKNLFNAKISPLALISSECQISETCVVYRFVKIKRSEIGKYTYISHNTDIDKAIIGKYCSIADTCRIGMPVHNLNQISTSPIFTEKFNAAKTRWLKEDKNAAHQGTVLIGNDVWIGSRVMIKDGIIIGDGAVIGAGAVVTKNIPAYAVAVGVPARIIKYRFPEPVIKKLEKLKWWDLPEDIIKENLDLFQKNLSNTDVKLLETSLDRLISICKRPH